MVLFNEISANRSRKRGYALPKIALAIKISPPASLHADPARTTLVIALPNACKKRFFLIKEPLPGRRIPTVF